MSSPNKPSIDSHLRPIVPSFSPVETGGLQRVEKREKKNVLRWIDGGTLLKKWGIDASDLANLIFNHGLQAWDIRGVAWNNPYFRCSTGYGSSNIESDWG